MTELHDDSRGGPIRRDIHAVPILGNDGLLSGDDQARSAVSFIARISGSGALLDPVDQHVTPQLARPPYADILKQLLRDSNSAHKAIIHPFDHGKTNPLVLLDEIRQAPPANMSLVHLDYYLSKNPVAATHLRSVLLACKPQLVAAQFGSECLTWCAANIGEDFKNVGKLRSHFEKRGVNSTALEKAIKATDHWLHNNHSSRGETMAINYSLLQLHNNGDLNNLVNLEKIIANPSFHIRAGDPEASSSGVFPLSRLAEYSLRAGVARGTKDYGDQDSASRKVETLRSGWEKSWPVYFDSLLGFVLYWKDIPQAVVSGMASDPDTFFVIQIHGVKGYLNDSEGKEQKRLSSRGLIGLRWEQMMVDLVEEYSLALGFTRLGLLGAANNQWLGSERNPTRRFNYRSAAERYDDLAENLEWAYHSGDRNWYKPIRQRPRLDRLAGTELSES